MNTSRLALVLLLLVLVILGTLAVTVSTYVLTSEKLANLPQPTATPSLMPEPTIEFGPTTMPSATVNQVFSKPLTTKPGTPSATQRPLR